MRVPFAATAAAVKKLDEAHASLDEAPRDEALLAEPVRFRSVDPVEHPCRVGFFIELQCFRNRALHLEGEFVGLDARAQDWIVGIIDAGELV